MPKKKSLKERVARFRSKSLAEMVPKKKKKKYSFKSPRKSHPKRSIRLKSARFNRLIKPILKPEMIVVGNKSVLHYIIPKGKKKSQKIPQGDMEFELRRDNFVGDWYDQATPAPPETVGFRKVEYKKLNKSTAKALPPPKKVPRSKWH